MNFKLVLKNSLAKLKNEYPIILILFFFLGFIFSLMLGITNFALNINHKLSDERVADKYRVDGEMEYRYNYFTEAGPYSAYFQDAIIQKLNTVLSDENQLALDNSEDVHF
jgi:hypothetical protein